MAINVLVTGIGTIIGYGIINTLRKSKYDVFIVGMDMNPNAVGKHWCDEFVIAEPANSDKYIPFLKETIDNHNIDLVLLGIEQDMNRISQSRAELEGYIDKIVINPKNVIDLTNDKWETFVFLKEHHLDAIESVLSNDYDELRDIFKGDFLVKPRRSYSSRGVKKIQDKITFDYYKYLLGEELMAQRIIGDDDHEYTAAAFCFGDGTASRPIILKRKLSFEGSTLTAEVVDSKEIDGSIKELVRILKPLGPTNFQYRIENGKAFLLEINPRFSSSTSIRCAFGYNEAEMAIDFYLFNRRETMPVIKKGKAIRYISDYIEII